MILRWQLDPVLIGGLLTLAVVYGLLAGPLRTRLAPGQPFAKAKAVYFYAALVVFYLAEGSPLHDLAEVYFFSAHMLQHLILCYVVAPLMLVGMPEWLLRRMLLNRTVAPVSRLLTHPLIAFFTFSFFLSLWHFPIFYEASLHNSLRHHVEHVLFLAVSLLMFWPLLSPLPELPRLHYGAQLIYLFLLPVAQLPVFALLTFSDTVFYPTYARAAQHLGHNALHDQTWGGVIMKIGGMVAFGVSFVLTFFRWYASEQRRTTTRQPKRVATR